jgi:small subunit ribosomal protein S16
MEVCFGKVRLTKKRQKKQPFYRVIVIDSRKEETVICRDFGTYDPLKNPSQVKIDTERAKYWISNGAQPTSVKKLLKISGLMS